MIRLRHKYAVTQSYIDNQKTAAQYQGIKINDEEAYNKIIGNILLAQEAEKRGFIVTEEDAKEFAQQMKKSILDNADNPEGNYQEIIDFIKGYGMTLDEYFDQPIVIETYRMGNQIALLRQQIFIENEHEFRAKQYTDEEFVEIQRQLINEIEQELFQKAEIVIMDE